LAFRGAKIVAVDLDLEAPGLDIILGVDTPSDIDGTAALLRQGIIRPRDEHLDVVASLRPVELLGARGAVWVLPAGRLDDQYLATIEELNIQLWHTLDTPQPLQRLLEDLSRTDIRPDAIFLDCRTGFHGLSATALFHVADIVVVCFTLSPQMWDGLDVIVRATQATQKHRYGVPELVLVPTLIPPGPQGKATLENYVDQVERKYATQLDDIVSDEFVADSDSSQNIYMESGIPYDSAIASVGRLELTLRTTSWGHFQPLAEHIGTALELQSESAPLEALDAATVLDELKIDRSTGFGDEVSIDELLENFVPPGDLVRLLDPSTALIVGAKGAGKTWLFRYLVDRSGRSKAHVPENITYVVGHAPSTVNERGDLNLSAEQLAELESTARMTTHGTHKAFWRLYAAARIADAFPDIRNRIDERTSTLGRGARPLISQLVRATDGNQLQAALAALLSRHDEVGTISDTVLKAIDDLILSYNGHVTLVYDGLDTGFDVGRKAYAEARQERFVRALLQNLLNRGQLRRVHFKTLLREDVFLNIEMQNKSHLDAAKVELRWRPEDLWRMALIRAKESPTYERHISSLPGGTEDPVKLDEPSLQKLLEPLWGATVQGKRKARTALYIQKRTSDAAGRLFPRTLIQLLAKAIAFERKAVARTPSERGRVLSFVAIKEGVDEASRRRVDDLINEYTALKPYLNRLREWKPVATESQFIERLKQRDGRKTASKRGGVTAGTLHVGQGGWKKVITMLKNVGVLGDYTRAKGAGGTPKLAVALLYRAGLQMRAD
jgi:hypothetical protein